MNLLGTKDLKAALNKVRILLKGKARHVYVFGSVASNSAVPYESDVDVLIIPKSQLTSKEAYDLLSEPWEMLMDKGLVLRPIVFNLKQHPPWLLQEAKKGVILI